LVVFEASCCGKGSDGEGDRQADTFGLEPRLCILTSIIGTFFVKLGAGRSIMDALYKGIIATGALSLVGVANAVVFYAPAGDAGRVRVASLSQRRGRCRR
jgi:hypothetical protein